MKNNVKEKIFIWLYRIFCYIIPCGIALWCFLIKTFINHEATIMDKVSAGGIFTLVIIVLIAVYFYGKHLRNSFNKVTNEILECLDNVKKSELIVKKRKIEAKQEMFHNACFIAPFILMWLLCALIEKKVISLRGTLMIMSLSMLSGFGFNSIAQWLKIKR